MKCDLCGEEVLPGQPRRGGNLPGEPGQKAGPPPGYERHWDCHTERFGTPASSLTIREELDSLRVALGTSLPAERPRPPVRRPNVLTGDYNRSLNAGRTFELFDFISEMGRRRASCDCPFCGTRFTVYVWSLSGGGKKCPGCRAMFGSLGVAYPLEGNEAL